MVIINAVNLVQLNATCWSDAFTKYCIHLQLCLTGGFDHIKFDFTDVYTQSLQVVLIVLAHAILIVEVEGVNCSRGAKHVIKFGLHRSLRSHNNKILKGTFQSTKFKTEM